MTRKRLDPGVKSLKQLLDADEKELSSWENKYRSKIIHLLKSIEIDTIYGMYIVEQ